MRVIIEKSRVESFKFYVRKVKAFMEFLWNKVECESDF